MNCTYVHTIDIILLSKQSDLIKGKNMCLRQLVLKVKIDRINEINQHLGWADNYGLSDDDHEGWDLCKELEKEKGKLQEEVDSLRKYIN